MDLSVPKICAVTGLAISVSACGTLYELDVTAHQQNQEVPGDTYVILSGDPDLPMDSREFQLHAIQLERALADRGYERVSGDDLDAAAMALYVSADIGDPKKSYHTVSRGVYESPYMEGTQAAARQSSGTGGSSGQTANKPTVLDRAPQEELVGYEKTSFATTVYTKHLNIVAVDLQQYLSDIQNVGRPNAVPKELWSVDVETTGSPSDLSEVVPVMIAAAQPYMGKSTDERVRVTMDEGDRRVRSIKKSTQK